MPSTLEINYHTGQVWLEGKLLDLTPSAFDLLAYLAALSTLGPLRTESWPGVGEIRRLAKWSDNTVSSVGKSVARLIDDGDLAAILRYRNGGKTKGPYWLAVDKKHIRLSPDALTVLDLVGASGHFDQARKHAEVSADAAAVLAEVDLLLETGRLRDALSVAEVHSARTPIGLPGSGLAGEIRVALLLRLARCYSQLFKLRETEDALREAESILTGSALARDYLLRAQLELVRAWLHWRRRSIVRAAEASRELELARKCLDKAEAQLIGHSHPAEASQLLTLRGKLQEAVFQEKRRPKPLTLLSDAKTFHYRALSLAAKTSSRYGVVIAQYNIAWSHYLTSQHVQQPSAQKQELEVARTWCESCIDYASRGQAGLDTSFARILLAGIYWRLGDCAKARDSAEQALNAAGTLGNRHEQALAHLALARVTIDNPASSDGLTWEQHLRQVEAIGRELDHRLLGEMADRERKRATHRGVWAQSR